MLRSTLSRPELGASGLAALEARWRAFSQVAEPSFFQDWTWVGCLAAERFPNPVLMELFEDDTLVGLALFNSRVSRLRGDALYLHESDDPVLDSIFTEHNGPLLRPSQAHRPEELLAQMFNDAMLAPVGGARARPRMLVLSGVGPACAAAARMTSGLLARNDIRIAPFLDFNTVPASQAFISGLSRNTRHQLRRSSRSYEALGKLVLHRADTVETALDYFNQLVALHNATWQARGKPGAFATPAVRRFHHALITRGVPDGKVDLLRVTAGPALLGYLLNFNHNGTVSAYQSGFNYQGATPHQKPGLTCHYLAIESYRAAGATGYDFLAGDDRYKLSLANTQRWLHWLSLAPRWHIRGIATRLGRALGAHRA